MDDERLDDLLDVWRVEPASMSLRDTVLASASAPGVRGLRRRAQGAFSTRGLRLWLAGAGVAAAVAGVSCGAVVSTVAIRQAQDEALVTAAVSEGSSAVVTFAEPARS